MRALLAVLFAGVAVAAMAQDGGPVRTLMQRLDTDAVRFNAWLPDTAPSREVVAAGHTVAMGGASANGAQYACFTCHGGNGAGDSAGAVPRLAGLPAFYLAAQLEKYASGERQNEIMTPIAQALEADEMRAVATYYAAMEPALAATTGAPPATGDLVQHGASLSAIGSAQAMIPACANCHGPYGTGMAPSVPPLAGQGSAYMSARLKAWRQLDPAEHPDNPMVSIAVMMSDRDIEASATYFEALGVAGAAGPERGRPDTDG